MNITNQNKFKKILSNQYFLIAIITFLALFVRLLNIDKPFGLWYDEMLTYIFSSKSLPFGIIKALWHEDFHMPLYYMYVHIWMKFFGSTDIVLRCSSVFWGVLTIPAFYFLGKVYKSKALGYFLSIVGCFSPIMIYYSQELRFYSMLIFFATISIIFFLKLLENINKKNLLLFHFSNLVILYIYTMGIVFVGIEILLLIIHYYFYKRNNILNLIKSIFIFFLFSTPYFYLLINYIIASTQVLIDPFAWGKSGIYAPLYILNDWLSPFLQGLYSNNTRLYQYFFKSFNHLLALFSLTFTSICFTIGFILSLLKLNKKTVYLTTTAALFILVEILYCLNGSLVLLTRYTLIILPIILLISCNGLFSIKNKRLKNICIFIILSIFIYNSINYKIAPSHSFRPSEYKYLANIVEELQLGENDYLLYPNRTELLKKYIKNINFIDFDIRGALYLDKSKKEASKIFNHQFILTTNKHNSSVKLMPYLIDDKPTKELEGFLNNSVEKLQKGQKIVIIDDNRYKFGLIKYFISQYKLNKIPQSDYNELFFGFIYQKTCIDILKALDNNSSLKKLGVFEFMAPTNQDKWHFSIYQKK